MKTKLSTFALGLTALAFMAFGTKSFFQQKHWPVPDAQKNKVNPLKGDALPLKKGKPFGVSIANPVMEQKAKVMDQKLHNWILIVVTLPKLLSSPRPMVPCFIKPLRAGMICLLTKRKFGCQ